MKRALRRAHRAIWPLLGGIVGIALALALLLRPPPDTPALAELPRPQAAASPIAGDAP
jgi:hypothetical protein